MDVLARMFIMAPQILAVVSFQIKTEIVLPFVKIILMLNIIVAGNAFVKTRLGMDLHVFALMILLADCNIAINNNHGHRHHV